MEPESNREASSSSPERPNQAAPIFVDDESYLDSEQIKTPLRLASPQQQPLNQKPGEQRERQLEQQLSQVRNELAAMESLMAEVSEIFELKYQQRLQPILEENNNLRQQLDQLHDQLQQLQPRHHQAQQYQPQPPQQARSQPLLPKLESPRGQRRQLQPAQSTATRPYKNITKITTIDIVNMNVDSPNKGNPSHRSQVTAISDGPQRVGLTRSRRLRVLAAALLHALGWQRTNIPAADPAPGPGS